MKDRIGPYQVTRELGRGGMGVVYLARDSRLDRDVAIKALPPELASDPARLERFEREAKTLAGLSHPNVAGIYGVEEQDGARYLVLEFVQGETLERLLDRGALPIDEAVELAVQIAAGVEAAHEAGVIHRDLKPGNIIVTPNGKAKVLDFGLARSDEPQGSSSGAMDSPTITTPRPQHSPTIAGAILGTAAYMSPEQARGRKVDKRSDIWSFGVVLYEMLVGVNPFRGETATDSIGAVLHKDVELKRLPPATPSIVRHVLSRCLERDRNRRLHDIADARIDLERAIAGEEMALGAAVAAAPGSPSSARFAWAVAVVALLAAAGLGAMMLRPAAKSVKERFVSDLVMPDGIELQQSRGPIELSPDGKRIVFVAKRGTDVVICISDLRTGVTKVLEGLDHPSYPFWSPNGKWIACASGRQLVRINSEGGRPEAIADLPTLVSANDVGGGAWRADGKILFSAMVGPLLLLEDRGGKQEIGLDLFPERAGEWPVCPQWLPDGDHYLVMDQDDITEDSGMYLCSLNEGRIKAVLGFETMARFVAPDWLVFWRAGDLHRQRMDMKTFDLLGEPERIATGVWRNPWPMYSSFSVLSGELLAYVPQSEAEVESELVWFDRATKEFAPTGIRGALWNPCISPGGDRIAFDRTTDSTGGDIAVFDIARSVETIISRDPSNESLPRWEPDGVFVYFYRGPEMYRARASGVGTPERILATGNSVYPNDITPDGSMLMYEEQVASQSDISALNLATGVSEPWLATPASEDSLSFSPDGKWAVYRSNQSGDTRLMIRSFPDGKVTAVVLSGLGSEPRWVGDEIIYFTPMHIMSIRVTFNAAGAPEFGDPVTVVDSNDVRDFDVTPDGKKLLLVRLLSSQRGGRIRLVQNWDQ